MSRLLLSLLIAVSISSCALLENKVDETVVDDRYSLELPMMLTPTNDLNDAASLQYRHVLNTYYVLVIDEPKSDLGPTLVENQITEYYTDDFEGYADIIFTNLDAALEGMEPSEVEDTQINGLPAKLMHFTGVIENLPLYYDMVLIEGKEDYYQILTWTLQSETDKCEEQMHKILLSFKEINDVESTAPASSAKPAPAKSGNRK